MSTAAPIRGGAARCLFPEGGPEHRDSEPAGPSPFASGDEIAPGYRVLEHLHRGADYDTYDVWSEVRFARCCIKTARGDRCEDRMIRRHLLLEGRLLTSLAHPHLVRGYELIRCARPQPPVLVLETLSGVTLAYIIDDLGQRLPAAALGHLGRHLCSVTRYLHGAGYLHLDIKPGNIITNAGRAQLIDLSLARPPGRYRRGSGTPAYMAPEQIRGGHLGPATDVWGIGLVLYEAATGFAPFDLPGPTPSVRRRTATADLADRYPQLTRRAPRIRARRRLAHPVADAIDACLAPDPDRRPTLAALDAALAALTGHDTPAPGPT
ncbi:serine/threonine-protein kinase [Pseudonocardia acidicola]|uniref:non-specific serine/threonine protein kinase n=1 Tax=Pseudonocardia acidicola TaxID=2724939 RepID=A0ABX1S826_9PSEU|nr:serine/threonine-protein kinase [Pseudonocardia acidicola]NMH97715.1 serine/threonine protein kinase [Pseudonocardia acidicola]